MATKPKPAPEHKSAEPVPVVPVVPASEARPSFLETLRRNRMGALTAGLVVAIVLGLLLSVLVPSDPGALAMIILGALLAAAVGFTVRYLSTGRGLITQLVAFVATALGVHLMAVIGTATGSMSGLEQFGVTGPSFNDALLLAFAAPAISAGLVLAGLVAAIIAGWGSKPVSGIDLD